MSRIAHIVTPLFVPADRPERFEKAARSGADAVILDLEDAVPPGGKDAARAALHAGFTDLPVIVRINAAGTPWHEDDLAALARLPIAAIMLPKAGHGAALARVAAVAPVIALVETVRGIAEVRGMASGGHVARLAFGSVDYAADLGCDHVRSALAAARAEVLVASRLADLPQPLDGVTTDVTDPAATQDDARHARALGFGGKLLIHPRQVTPARAGFRPGGDEIAWAERVLGSGDGAAAVDGAMVDEPVRLRARRLLDRAERLAAIEP
ncbi:MAG: CoA ester lyase [Sphingomonas taxi]|uniref:CoA ester lyase n=1 Tax=Sphingomonas taxi TaxID=1549858 RepID=A0A2W5PEU9_9SPHN|nr:MAG: CoA ester lyase [Sphingomonas taxi]